MANWYLGPIDASNQPETLPSRNSWDWSHVMRQLKEMKPKRDLQNFRTSEPTWTEKMPAHPNRDPWLGAVPSDIFFSVFAPRLSQLIPEQQHHEGSTFIIIITTTTGRHHHHHKTIGASSHKQHHHPRTARSYSTFPIPSVQGTHQRFQALRFRQVEEQIHLPLASMSFDPWLLTHHGYGSKVEGLWDHRFLYMFRYV